MEEENRNKDKGFVIKDRRLFGDSGNARAEDKVIDEDPLDVKDPKAGPTLSAAEGESAEAERSPLPEINFASFIFSLSTTAMYHFGDFPDPVTNQPQRNLPAAKQTIDLLTILKAKTEGNLDDQERALLEGILYELRMRFVKEMKNP